MDIEQTVVLSLHQTMTAVDRIVRRLDPSRKSLSTQAFRRLVAYELLASPETTNFNHAFTTQSGHLYVEQRTASSDEQQTSEGCMVLRAPLLQAVGIILDAYVASGNTPESMEALARSIVAQHKQRLCCWFSVSKKKACPCDAVELPTQAQQHVYVFCNKHWSPVMRKEGTHESDVIRPSSETDLDDWLEAIV